MSLDSIKPALIPSNLLAVWSCLRFTVRSAFDLTFEYVCHPCISDWFWLMVPQLLLVTACNLWDNKLDILGYQLTLLPGHWLTGISPSPDLSRKCIKEGQDRERVFIKWTRLRVSAFSFERRREEESHLKCSTCFHICLSPSWSHNSAW